MQSLGSRTLAPCAFDAFQPAIRGVTRRGLRQNSATGSIGFRLQGSGFRVQGLGFRVQGLGFRVWGLGFGV